MLFVHESLVMLKKATLENIHNKIETVGLSDYLSYSNIIWFRDEK